MKPLYLVDECCNERKNIEIEQFAKSTDIIGSGATDEEVFELAKKLKVPVITADQIFVLNMIIENSIVIFKRGIRTFYIESKVVEDIKYSDPVTYYLQTHDTIIVP